MPTPWIPAVTTVADGQDVSAETLDPIFQQFVQRTQYLYEQFQAANDKTVLIAFGQPIFPNATISTNNVVYYTNDGVNEGINLAEVGFLVRSETTSNNYTPSNSSYSLGIVKQVSNNSGTADVYTLGLVEFDVDIDDPVNGLIQSDEIDQSSPFYPGPYYLSRSEAGKITSRPGGVPVYVGYALSRRSFMLSPNTTELSQFFIAYNYTILDRPAGIPVLTNGVWTITNPNFNVVGWVGVSSLSAALQILAPPGADFYYNLPATTLIGEDPGIVADDQVEQAELAQQLPPNPPNLTFLTVNGIGQIRNSAAAPDGIYVVNDAGIWWFNNTDGSQPWASDILTPSNPAYDPTIWDTHRGSDGARPRISLQFVKLNPNISASLVTSIKKYNNNSEAISIWQADKSAESLTGTGDLLLRMLLNFVNGVPLTSAGTAVQSLTYNETTGNITVVNAPIVSVLTPGSGITISQTKINNTVVPGNYIISSTTNSTSGRVSSLEPDGADLIYVGLHSYVSMPAPSVYPSSVIGKITLPSGTPSADMSFVMFLTIPDSGGSGKAVDFNFSYAISAPGVVLSNTVVTNPITFTVPTPYTTKAVFKAASTNANGAIAIANFTIPAAAIGTGDLDVNFQLTRTTVNSNPLTTPLGLVDIYWKIG